MVISAMAFTICWFARPADVSFEEVRASVRHSESSRFAEIDGVRIHYQEKGLGTPLVLLHGFTSSTYSWKDVFEPLSKTFRVIAVDLKGFGFSAKPDGDYTRRAQAQLVAHLLNHLKIEKAWLVVNSMGGEVALNVALGNPQLVAGLILIDSAGVAVTGGSSLAPAYVRIPFVGRALMALALTSDKLVRQGLEKSFYDYSKVTAERVVHYYRPLTTRGGQLAAIRARTQSISVEQDRAINARTLIIWAPRCSIPWRWTHNELLIKDPKLVVIENAVTFRRRRYPPSVEEVIAIGK